jgi:hypothetical protein
MKSPSTMLNSSVKRMLPIVVLSATITGCYTLGVGREDADRISRHIDRNALLNTVISEMHTNIKVYMKTVTKCNCTVKTTLMSYHDMIYLLNMYCWLGGDTRPTTEFIYYWSLHFDEIMEYFDGLWLEINLGLVDRDDIETHIRIPKDMSKYIKVFTDRAEQLSIKEVLLADRVAILSALDPEYTIKIRLSCPCEMNTRKIKVNIGELERIQNVEVEYDYPQFTRPTRTLDIIRRANCGM